MLPQRIELPTNLQVGSVNAYLFTGPEPILVDAGIGTDACWEALQAGLALHGLTVADLSRVVITHPHVDHYGLAARIVAQSDADVWIAEPGAPWLDPSRALWQQRLAYHERYFLPAVGLPPELIAAAVRGMATINSLADPLPPERVVAFAVDGVVQMGGWPWRVLFTPGHAGTQTCFYQPETRQLLSSDHLMAVTPTPVVENVPGVADARVPALPRFLESLALVEALEVDAVHPGHGRAFGNHRAVIARQRTRIADRKLECLELVRGGADSAVDLLAQMYSHIPLQGRIVALYMLVGYLDLLLADGAVVRETVDGVWRFRATG